MALSLPCRILMFAALGLVSSCAASPPRDTTSLASWQGVPDRTWIGPEYWANRLQDWRLHGGELQCVEASGRYPLRTLMLLTEEVRPGDGDLVLRVETFPVDSDSAVAEAPPRGWSGFLLGAGNAQVDYRISAQVHHRPALDGGLFVVVDRVGRLRVFDNGVAASAGGRWSIGGALGDGELPQLAQADPPSDVFLDGPIALELRVMVVGDQAQLWATALDASSGNPLSSLTLSDLAPNQVDGLLGLVSHLGPKGSGMGFAFRDWSRAGSLLEAFPERTFGPILATQYTVAEGVLKMTAQMGPLGAEDSRTATLEARALGGPWRECASAVLEDHVFLFRVEDWDSSRDWEYRVRYLLRGPDGSDSVSSWSGKIPAEPDRGEVVLASLNCVKHYVGDLAWNGSSIWFPHAEVVEHVAAQAPDMLYFAGDQLYEGDLDPVDARSIEKLKLDYLYKWSRWCWSFRELTRDRPTVTIPDDHDVYQGNLWGAGGRKAMADKARGLTAQDSGGYVHPAEFVNLVHRTQTAHLPDPFDPTPCAQGISVYGTTFTYGGIGFAVVADRQFKDSASDVVPVGEVKNGWFQAEGFDPRDADVPGASFLGARQEAMLEDWAQEQDPQTWSRVLLSQTPFVNVATIPEKASGGAVLPSLPVPQQGEYPEGYRFAADTDSGGWPQTPRRRAVSALRDAGAIHLAGDQHLGSLVQYGVDTHRDGSFVFTAPAVANTWPRRWWPAIPGGDAEPDAPHYTGDFTDGFGNLMTVWAVANPVRSGLQPAALYDRMPGYGIVRFDREASTVTFECWPRWEDPRSPDAAQYPGWPFVLER
ncbi:MAG: alkaline phosphatase D family protein [Planctomycetota bacterium]